MRKYYYYIISAIICSLLFAVPAYASTSSVVASKDDDDGYNVTVEAQTYTSITPDEIYQKDNSPKYWYKWNVSQNIEIKNLRKNRYYNGRLSFILTDNLSIGSRSNVTINNNKIAEGLYAFIDAVSTNSYRIVVIFDNYYTTDTAVGLGSINLEYRYVTDTASDDPLLSTRTSVSISWISGLKSFSISSPQGFAGVLFDMIVAGIANTTEFDDIISLLTSIRNQDSTYYVMLVNNLAQLHTDNQTLHSDLSSILSELDLDFASVQTVLDLFPSYRTQVLQYWQELLQMNASQSSEAAEIESQYADRDSKSDNLLSGLDSMQFPTISSGDLNVLKNVDTEGKANFFGLISLITNNSLVTNILLIVVTGIIAGYALYGKKS